MKKNRAQSLVRVGFIFLFLTNALVVVAAFFSNRHWLSAAAIAMASAQYYLHSAFLRRQHALRISLYFGWFTRFFSFPHLRIHLSHLKAGHELKLIGPGESNLPVSNNTGSHDNRCISSAPEFFSNESILAITENQIKPKIVTMKTQQLIILKRELDLLEGHLKKSNLSEFNKQKLLGELKSAKVVKDDELPEDVVCLDSTVKICEEGIAKKFTFQIVLPSEANLKKNKISVFAPIGIALLGYQVGAHVSWEMPNGVKVFQILEVTHKKNLGAMEASEALG